MTHTSVVDPEVYFVVFYIWGDRVLIGGTKVGHLRYLGTTDFAKGEWAGVELDDPIGKNDGAVAGKR